MESQWSAFIAAQAHFAAGIAPAAIAGNAQFSERNYGVSKMSFFKTFESLDNGDLLVVKQDLDQGPSLRVFCELPAPVGIATVSLFFSGDENRTPEDSRDGAFDDMTVESVDLVIGELRKKIEESLAQQESQIIVPGVQ